MQSKLDGDNDSYQFDPLLMWELLVRLLAQVGVGFASECFPQEVGDENGVAVQILQHLLNCGSHLEEHTDAHTNAHSDVDLRSKEWYTMRLWNRIIVCLYSGWQKTY